MPQTFTEGGPDDARALHARGPGRFEALGFAFAAAALLLSQLGYSFERGDQLQYLLLPYRTIYPNFVRSDWFTWHTTHYHHAFSWVVIGLHALAGEARFAWAVFFAHVCVLLALGYACLRLARAFGLGSPHAAFALAVLALIREAGLGGDTLNHAQLVPSDMALPPFLLACATWLEGETLAAGAWLGASGLLHANFALLGPLVLGLPEATACLRARRLRPLLELALPFAAIAAPTLFLTAQGFLARDRAPEAISIMFEIRSPHHYHLAAFPPQDFAWFALVLVSGLPAWREVFRARDAPARRRALVGSLVALLALGLVGSLLQVKLLIRLFFWRLSIPLTLIALFVTAEAALRLWQASRSRAVTWILGCAAAAAPFVRDDLAQIGPLGVPGAWFALPLLVPLAAAGALLATGVRLRAPLLALLIAPALAFGARAATSPLAGAASAEDEVQQWRKLRGPRVGEFLLHPKPAPLYDRVRELTPEGATFLASPSLIGFRIQARRAIFVDWKCVPMKGEEALEWKRRMLALFGTREFPLRGYELRKGSGELYQKRELGALAALAHQEHLDYLIANRNQKPRPEMRLQSVFVSGGWRVYKVLPNPPAATPIPAPTPTPAPPAR